MQRDESDAATVPGFDFTNMDWGNFIAIAGLHVACLLAPFYFTWGALGIAVLLWWAAGSLGICMGYHRLLTHRSFKTPKLFEYFLTTLGSLNWQGGPVKWVGTHRLHHKESDTDKDPHSPMHGFSWAHVLWCFVKDPAGRDPRKLAPDLERDRVHALLDRFFWVPQVALAVVLYALGGLPWVIWGVAVRTVFSYHATWFVNSASHYWGYRNYETREESRNNWWVALISWGEGWHNNHHAHQRSAAHGLRWFEIDVTYWMIVALSWVGLARDIVLPKPEEMPKGSRA